MPPNGCVLYQTCIWSLSNTSGIKFLRFFILLKSTFVEIFKLVKPNNIINQFIEIIGERQIRMNDLYNYLLYQTIASKLPERIILKENIKELIDVDC